MTPIRLAIQKSGRLSEDSLALIKDCGINIPSQKDRLKATATNFPLEMLFLRDDDIPGYVEDGVADIGVAGENVIEEKGKEVEVLHKLGFGKCRLSVAVPKTDEYKSIHDLAGKGIATSYPRILGKFLEKNGVKSHIHEISGSVEIAPSIGLSDAICDLVSSGSTLFQNNLKEAETILKSEAVLIAHPKLSVEKKDMIDQLLFRIRSLQRAKNNKYILLNAPKHSVENIIKILPGMKSPTVVPLADSGWVSIHSVINENDFWDKIENLKEAGAQGILVVPIEKMIL
jgi:ATP phosphoribosyltransferase